MEPSPLARAPGRGPRGWANTSLTCSFRLSATRVIWTNSFLSAFRKTSLARPWLHNFFPDIWERLQLFLLYPVLELCGWSNCFQPLFLELLIFWYSPYPVSIENVSGYFFWSGSSSWETDKLPLVRTERIQPAGLHQLIKKVDVSLVSSDPRQLSLIRMAEAVMLTYMLQVGAPWK